MERAAIFPELFNGEIGTSLFMAHHADVSIIAHSGIYTNSKMGGVMLTVPMNVLLALPYAEWKPNIINK